MKTKHLLESNFPHVQENNKQFESFQMVKHFFFHCFTELNQLKLYFLIQVITLLIKLTAIKIDCDMVNILSCASENMDIF